MRGSEGGVGRALFAAFTSAFLSSSNRTTSSRPPVADMVKAVSPSCDGGEGGDAGEVCVGVCACTRHQERSCAMAQGSVLRRIRVTTCFAAPTLALCSSSSRTTESWPFWAARIRPVHPSCRRRTMVKSASSWDGIKWKELKMEGLREEGGGEGGRCVGA
jgi:hypothetical protein